MKRAAPCGELTLRLFALGFAPLMILQLVQIVYWLALATWFGSALFIAVACRVIFKTVQENNPVLPHVLSVNLEGQHGTLLAGTIVGNILAAFVRIELGCCALLILTLMGQAVLINLNDPAIFVPILLRAILLLAAGAIALYDWRFVWPRMWRYRQEFLDHADEPDVANPAKDEFDRYQRQSLTLLEILLFVLLGMVLFSGSASITPSRAPLLPATRSSQASLLHDSHALAPA
jgi:hypothetical protein